MSKKTKKIPLIFIVIVIIVIVLGFRQLTKKEYDNGADETASTVNTYSRTIINKSYDEETKLKIIEINTIDESLDSIIVTSEMIEEVKENEGIYNNTLKEILESDSISSKNLYNITKAIELGYVTESNTYIEYYSKLIDFETKEEFIEFCEEAFSTIVSNTYSSKTLIIEASTDEFIEEYSNIKSAKEIVDGIYLVEFDTEIDTEEVYKELQISGNVQNIMTDHKIYMTNTDINEQSVQSSNYSWGVETTGLGHYSSKLNYENNSEEITIAVLDTGIYSSHEAFCVQETADKIDFTYSYDYINSDSDPSDDNGHGTQVSGVIAETTSNNIKIAPVKILDSQGAGNLSDLMEAMDDIYKYVDVINLSLGFDVSTLTSSEKTILEKFFKKIYDYGTIVVCASGNEGTDVYYPACSTYTLAVSAVNSSGNIASFSNYGDEIDFALPGVSLYLPSYTGVSSYSTGSGTSFSSPFLASAIALIKADYSYTNIDDIITVLKENAEDLGDEGKDEYYGYGRIDFDLSMFETPIIANMEVKETTWAKENTIIVDTISSSNIEYYALTLTDDEPSDWVSVPTSSTDIELEITTTNNGTNYVWIKDKENNIGSGNINVEYVDNNSPTITNFINTSYSDTDISVQISAQDDESGILEIDWYYKKSSDNTYTEICESCTDDGVGQKSIDTTYIFSELEAKTKYQIYGIIFDVVGNYSQTEEIEVTTLSSQINVSIENLTLNQATITIGDEERTDDFETTITEGIFYITCELPCVIMTTSDEISYSRMKGEAVTEDNYKFSFDIYEGIEIIIALKGDVNLNGVVNTSDAMMINRACLSSTQPAYSELSSINSIIADVNESGDINISDAMLINRSILSKTSSTYLKLSW